ncbi:MAG TPA: hypothetical protein VGC42_03880 [Kofleriaceae bacterium]
MDDRRTRLGIGATGTDEPVDPEGPTEHAGGAADPEGPTQPAPPPGGASPSGPRRALPPPRTAGRRTQPPPYGSAPRAHTPTAPGAPPVGPAHPHRPGFGQPPPQAQAAQMPALTPHVPQAQAPGLQAPGSQPPGASQGTMLGFGNVGPAEPVLPPIPPPPEPLIAPGTGAPGTPGTGAPGTGAPNLGAPRPPASLALDAVTPRTSARDESLSRHFLGISMRRAYRLHIRTDEVLPSERNSLESQARHITNPEHQAFLAWRRSVLLLVAMMFVPLTIFRIFETFDGYHLPLLARAFQLLPALAEGAFCIIAFDQLRNWAQWKQQRRILFIAWAIYFIAPFLVYAYPYRSAFDSYYASLQHAEVFGIKLNANIRTIHTVVGLAFGVQALFALGPKIISLMPGLIRASIVTKLLFPGTTAPGWLMMLAAPLYALFAYIIVLLPYQITGSWEFVIGNLGVLGAQIYIGFSGRRLTVPLSTEESHHRIHKAWLLYIGILVVSAGFMAYGLYDFISQVHWGPVRVVTGILTVVSNVLLDTLVGTDAIVSAMAYFRNRGVHDEARQQLLRDADTKLDVFCG